MCSPEAHKYTDNWTIQSSKTKFMIISLKLELRYETFLQKADFNTMLSFTDFSTRFTIKTIGILKYIKSYVFAQDGSFNT